MTANGTFTNTAQGGGGGGTDGESLGNSTAQVSVPPDFLPLPKPRFFGFTGFACYKQRRAQFVERQTE